MKFAVETVHMKGPKRGQPNYLYIPLPKQALVHELVAAQMENPLGGEEGQLRVLFGGARGGSKSHFARWLTHQRCLTITNYQALLLRESFPQLEKYHLRRVALEAQALGADYVDSKRLVRYPNGSIFEFGYCETRSDANQYVGLEYDQINVDELTMHDETGMLLVFSSARTSKPNVRPLILGCTNPGGPGAHWVKQRWVDKTVDTLKFPYYNPETHAYVPSTLDDNPYPDKGYEATLNELPTELREAYRFGNWDIFPGQYFDEWRKDRHVTVRTIDPADTNIKHYGAVDWGYAPHPGVMLWIAVLPNGHAYVEREYVFSRTVAKDVAIRIRSMTKEMGVKVTMTVGDTQMWAADGQIGESIAETFSRHGVPMQQADKERVNGWQRVRHWLRPLQDASLVTFRDGVPVSIRADESDKTLGRTLAIEERDLYRPWLQVSPECKYLIRTLPSLMMDAHKHEDVDTNGDDHAADALRYWCMGRPSPGSKKTIVQYAAGTVGALKQSLAEKARRYRYRRAA